MIKIMAVANNFVIMTGTRIACRCLYFCVSKHFWYRETGLKIKDVLSEIRGRSNCEEYGSNINLRHTKSG